MIKDRVRDRLNDLELKVTIIDIIGGNKVRVGIEAPHEVPVYREEIYSAVKEENAAAAAADASQLPDELPEPSSTPKTT